MARQPFNTFLPFGAVEESPYPPGFGSHSTSISPLAVPPRAFPTSVPTHVPEGRSASPKPYSYTSPILRSSSQQQDGINASHSSGVSTQHPNDRSLSPYFGRTSAGEDSHAAQVQKWRIYTQHLRENAQGERAHMEADRARMEEVMAEERALWDQERAFLKSRIEELESQIAANFGHQSPQQGLPESEISPGNCNGLQHKLQQLPHRTRLMTSSSTAQNGNSAKQIRQESGRNPDGSPFYAPAPRNPSRTFEASQSDDLRVDSMSAPRETPIRITSKELTESDFGIRSSSTGAPSLVGNESIDISHLQPGLEGVLIKASAIAPAFVAQVRTPNSSLSPSKPSSHVSSPPRRQDVIRTHDGLNRTSPHGKKSTLEVIAAPENHRLTMNAGHTPNHSIHKLDLGDSGGATPTQGQLRLRNSIATGETEQHFDENIDPDPELQGPLGLKNDSPTDKIFLTVLTNKLREVKETGLLSPSEKSVQSDDQNIVLNSRPTNVVLENKGLASVEDDVEDDDPNSAADEAPVLKVKPSMNFGRPFGSL